MTATDTTDEDLRKLLPCPFCGQQAAQAVDHMRCGHGEYESFETYLLVRCTKCFSGGRSYHQARMVQFTPYTVSDLRGNPALRAKAEDDYEAYCQQRRRLAVEAWNKRAGE